MRKSKTKILAILPISIGGRLTMNSIIDGFKQNDCRVTVYDNLFGKNLSEILEKKFDYITGYDYDGKSTSRILRKKTISLFTGTKS